MMTGALMSWGCRGQKLDEMLRLARRHHVSRVVDIRQPSTYPQFGQARLGGSCRRAGIQYQRSGPFVRWNQTMVSMLYSDCRGGARVLLLDVEPDPAGTAREVMLRAIAREAALYARSQMARIIQQIEIAHLVGTERRDVVWDHD